MSITVGGQKQLASQIEQGESMKKDLKFDLRTVVGVVLAAAVFFAYVANVRPVSWFDALVGLIFGVATFVIVKKFAGFK